LRGLRCGEYLATGQYNKKNGRDYTPVVDDPLESKTKGKTVNVSHRDALNFGKDD